MFNVRCKVLAQGMAARERVVAGVVWLSSCDCHTKGVLEFARMIYIHMYVYMNNQWLTMYVFW